MDAVVAVLTSPLVVLLGLLAAGAIGFVVRVEGCRHYFANRHPSGVWVCSHCPATRDRHGRIHR